MYRLYLDEFGTDDLSCLDQDNHRYMSLTGVIVRLDHVAATLSPRLDEIKSSVFDADPDEPIHLHRSDIVRRKKIFGQLNDNAKRALFDAMLLKVLHEVHYTTITVVIDKLQMTRQVHWQQRHPYHYLLEIMIEKFVQFLERHDADGDVMPEARQGKKDDALMQEFTRICNFGTRFRTAEQIRARLRSKTLKFRRKPDNVSGLQLCDLLAHPSHLYVRKFNGHNVNLGAFGSQVVSILLQAKYDRSNTGRVQGYGFKYCP